MTVTAEGVETAEQLAILTQLGCLQVQGHLIAHPMAASAIAAWLVQFQFHPDSEVARLPASLGGGHTAGGNS